MSFQRGENPDFQDIDKKYISEILRTLKEAEYDDEFNDGRKVKIEACDFTLKIVYEQGTEIIIQLWTDRILIGNVWYLLNTRDIAERIQ